jgi:hypothetical protein
LATAYDVDAAYRQALASHAEASDLLVIKVFQSIAVCRTWCRSHAGSNLLVACRPDSDLILFLAVQGYQYEHIGGDLNSKITEEASKALDDVYDSVMLEFRNRKRILDDVLVFACGSGVCCSVCCNLQLSKRICSRLKTIPFGLA